MSPCNPLRRSLDRSSTRIPLRPSLPAPFVPRRLDPFRRRPAGPLCRPPLHDPPGCDYSSARSPHSLLPTYPRMPPAATRRRTRTLGAPLLLAADAKAARRCIWGDAKEASEPSEVLSNEPQASCRNSRSGKFPRRPYCFSTRYTCSLSLSLSLRYPQPHTDMPPLRHELRRCTCCISAAALSLNALSIFFIIALLLPPLPSPSFAIYTIDHPLAHRDFFPRGDYASYRSL